MFVSCPSCRSTLELPDDAIGAETDCPVCGVEFDVEDSVELLANDFAGDDLDEDFSDSGFNPDASPATDWPEDGASHKHSDGWAGGVVEGQAGERPLGGRLAGTRLPNGRFSESRSSGGHFTGGRFLESRFSDSRRSSGGLISDAPVGVTGERLTGERLTGEGVGGERLSCPICGCSNPATFEDCRACGTAFQSKPRRQRHRAPRGIFVGDILITTVTIFFRSFRFLVGSILVEMIGIFLGLLLVLMPVAVMLNIAANAPGPPNRFLLTFVLAAMLVPMFAVWQAAHVGHYRLMLKVARGESVAVSELLSIRGLFGGGPAGRGRGAAKGKGSRATPGLSTKMVLLGALFWTGLLLGGVLLVVPGLVFALMAWPFGRVLVDRNPPGIGAILESIELVAPHWPGVMSVVSLLWGVQFGLGLVPWLAGTLWVPLIIFLVITPFSSLALTVTYLRLRDEPTAVEVWAHREQSGDALAWEEDRSPEADD